MFRGRAARTGLTLLLTAVLTLALAVSARAFTPAHTSPTPVQLSAPSPYALPAAGEQGPVAGPGDRTHPRDAVEVFRTRDRHRAAAGGTQHPCPAPPAPVRRAPALVPPGPAGPARPHQGRAVPDLTAATLQVFRC
ncbi:hypothetical protein [Streptomyces sp. NPDC049813]|uniref:hypothetical protein n=1 Tax=Streptomyces sp. NPDC049813 TaxID=3365597 RepID=UPI003799D431